MKAEAIAERVDVAELVQGFRGQVLQPGDAGYDEARKVWNGSIDRRPAVIARCTGAADVISAVRFARSRDLLIAVRGGGHNIAGLAVRDGGIVIDCQPMKGFGSTRNRNAPLSSPGCYGVSWTTRRRPSASPCPAGSSPPRASPASPWGVALVT